MGGVPKVWATHFLFATTPEGRLVGCTPDLEGRTRDYWRTAWAAAGCAITRHTAEEAASLVAPRPPAPFALKDFGPLFATA